VSRIFTTVRHCAITNFRSQIADSKSIELWANSLCVTFHLKF
jgi:hypothetical protein